MNVSGWCRLSRYPLQVAAREIQSKVAACRIIRGRAAVRRPRSGRQTGLFAIRQQRPSGRDICPRLEGIPLALELAAARVTCSRLELTARVDDRFVLLSAGVGRRRSGCRPCGRRSSGVTAC